MSTMSVHEQAGNGQSLRMKGVSNLMRLLGVCMSVLMAALLMVGCAPDPKAQIEELLNQDLSQVSSLDASVASELIDDSLLATLSDYDVDPQELLGAFYAHFTYEIKDIQVQGDTATATVTSSNVDFSAVTTNWIDEFGTWAISQEAVDLYSAEGEQGVASHGVQMLLDLLSAADAPEISTDTTLDLVKTDGTWGYADQSQLINVVLAGFDMSSISLE